MATLIHLGTAVPAGPDAYRVAYPVGRALPAADFARQGRYIADRLRGLAPTATGVREGLDVSFQAADATGPARLAIGIGSAIGGDGRLARLTTPITIAWIDLARAVGVNGAVADGIYLLLIRTVEFDGVDGPPPDPVERANPD